MLAIAHTLAVFVIIATALPLVRGSAWWIRVFDFPRLHFAAVGAIALFLFLFSGPLSGGEKMLAAAAAVSVLFQAFQIYLYTPLSSKQSSKSEGDGPGSISLLVANVLMTNREADQLIETVRRRRPDLVLLLEPDEWWDRKMGVLYPEYPFRIRHPLDNTYGLILLSRLKLIDPGVRFLVDDSVPSIHVQVELRSGIRTGFYGLHPRPPRPATGGSAKRDTELSIVARETSQAQEWPVIVAGDLNDVAWSHSTRQFQRISGLLDPRVGRGMYNTFNAKIPLIRFPVDHAFHSEHFRLIVLEREEYFGSDHFPIYIHLQYNAME